MNDPYKVLGVERTATDEEVKKAYRDLAKKYHPDNYADSNLADLANEKMKEINEAYDEIQKERSGKGSTSSGYGGGYSGSSSGSYSSSPSYARVRVLINSGNYIEADRILESIETSDRGAEWNFLKGCVCIRRGWYIDAQRYLDAACAMDPNNAEYTRVRDEIANNAGSFGRVYRKTTSSDSGCSTCDLCTGMMCADCLCEACGSDCIRCY